MTAQLVSIVIPCFNAEKNVNEAIERALGRTGPSKEVMYVDDGLAAMNFMLALDALGLAPCPINIREESLPGRNASRSRRCGCSSEEIQ